MNLTKNFIINIKKDQIEVTDLTGTNRIFEIDKRNMQTRTEAVKYIKIFLQSSGLLGYLYTLMNNNRYGVKVIGCVESVYYILYINILEQASKMRLYLLGYNAL